MDIKDKINNQNMTTIKLDKQDYQINIDKNLDKQNNNKIINKEKEAYSVETTQNYSENSINKMALLDQYSKNAQSNEAIDISTKLKDELIKSKENIQKNNDLSTLDKSRLVSEQSSFVNAQANINPQVALRLLT